MKRIIITIFFTGFALIMQSQSDLNSGLNPFKQFGYTPKIATLSNGKYVESFDDDSIVQIGTVLLNVRSRKIVELFVVEDTSEIKMPPPDVASIWISPDPLFAERPEWTPYNYCQNNPINRVDPSGLLDDWVESANGRIYWDENATSQATTKSGETYLGKNVLVGTHNRGANLNESINSAMFDLYLESNKEGPTATIWGNTVPADVNQYGTMAEGIYPAAHTKYLGHDALLINGGGNIPTVNGNNNPEAWQNFNADGTMKPKSQQMLNGVLFHIGNNKTKSLSLGEIKFSIGCQTGGCGPGSAKTYDNFAKFLVGFKGSYYLRNSYHLEKPYKCNMK
jgi:hypothetical protein